MSFNKLMLISTTLILMVGCKRATSDDTKATLHLALPAAFQVSQKNWGISEPADFSGYNCYGVFVEAPEDPKNTCKNTAGVTVASPTEWFGGFWAGGGSSNIVDIPVTTGAGQKRKISVVGLKTIDQATCEKLHDAVADSSMSPPAILGSSTIDLNPGETKDLRIDVSYNSRIVMDDCTGPDFNHNDDGSPTTTTTTSTTTTTLLTNAVLSSSSPSLANLTAIPYDDQTTHTVTYTITNTGTETATAMSVSVSGNPNYTINGNTCASTLGINGTCTFNLNFIAPPPGSYPFTITVGFTDSTGSHSYPIANTGSSVMAVQPLYGGRDRWNDYVLYDGSDLITASNSPCNYADNRCIQAGRMRKVVTSYASCFNLTMTDSLGVFDWRCWMMNGRAVFISEQFLPGKGLKHLLNSTPAFQPNSVSLRFNGSVVETSTPHNWWPTNSVTFLPDSSGGYQTLATTDTIYVATTGMSNQKGWHMGANGIAIVSLPSMNLNWNSASATINCNNNTGNDASPTSKCMIFGGYDGGPYRHRVWVEATLMITSGPNPVDYAVLFSNCKRCQIHETDIASAASVLTGSGIYHYLSAYSNITSSRISGLGYGLDLEGATHLLVQGSTFAKNTSGGVVLNALSSSNTFYDTMVNNSGGYGISTASSDRNTFINTYLLSNAGGGIQLGSNSNTVVNLTAVNNTGAAIYLSASSNSNSLTGLLAVSNDTGLSTQTGVATSSIGSLYSANNSVYGIINASAGLSFSTNGKVWLGGNTTACSFSTAPTGVTASNCTSAAGLVMSSTMSAPTFAGTPAPFDAANLSNTGSSVSYAAITDWTHFSELGRGWTKSGTLWSATTHGVCSSGTCDVFDLQLATTDIYAKNLNGVFTPSIACPAAASGSAKTLSTYVTGAATPYLMNAIEVLDQPFGNNNGLCETGEVCVYAANLGAYQGRGALTEPCTFTSGTISNVKLLSHTTN